MEQKRAMGRQRQAVGAVRVAVGAACNRITRVLLAWDPSPYLAYIVIHRLSIRPPVGHKLVVPGWVTALWLVT